MIFYRPTDGDPATTPITNWPRTCFLMTQLGGTVPAEVRMVRTQMDEVLAGRDYAVIDADSMTTGRYFLLKIWEIIVGVPLGVAILHEDMRPGTIANIFYEMGLMQAYGKETIVVKTPAAKIPSDFVRTEYIVADEGLAARLGRFLGRADK